MKIILKTLSLSILLLSSVVAQVNITFEVNTRFVFWLDKKWTLDSFKCKSFLGKVVPMMCGSAFKNKGVQAMLDMVMEILPSP